MTPSSFFPPAPAGFRYNAAMLSVPVSPPARAGRRDPWSAAFVACWLLLACGLLVQPLADPDVYIHLRDGRYLVEHGFRVDREPFSYTAADKPFETVEWLFRTGAYLTWRLGGLDLLILLKSLALTAALFLLGRLLYRRWPNLGGVTVLLVLGALAPMTRLFPERPYVFTYLFLPLVMLWLEDLRSAPPEGEAAARRRLWLLPLLTVPWANLHPGFLVVFGFLGAQAAEDAWRLWTGADAAAGRRLRTLGAVSAAVFLAGAVNPMGFELYSFILKTTGSREFMQYLLEWAPPRLASEPVFFGLLALAWLAQAANWRRTRLADLLVLGAFSYLGLSSYRNLPLFVIAALPGLAANLAGLRAAWFPAARFPAAWRPRALAAGGALALLLLAAAGATGWALRGGPLQGFYPRAGVQWLSNQPFQGRLLTHDIWGGYLGWATHGKVKVFIDGRMPTFGEKLYAEYRKMIWGDPQECLPLLDRYRIEGVLVSPKNDPKLFQRFWGSDEWSLVYWDDVCLLYVRRQGANAAWAAPLVYTAMDPKRTPYFNPAEMERALAEVERGRRTAPWSFLPYYFLGDLQLRLGRLPEARAALTQAIRIAPRHAASHLALGLLCLQERRPSEAEAEFRTVLRIQDDRTLVGVAAFHLGTLLAADPLRRAEARRWADRAAELLPDWDQPQQLKRSLTP
jgi:tetratricopeptide (TPR) repeat protein